MRSYSDRCGIARSLDVVGERWALLVVRELLLGPKRFTDLRAGLPHVSPDVLSQRLRDLEAAGIVRRLRPPPPAGAQAYELTDRGHALEPVLLELGRWGSAAPFPAAEDARIGPDALAVALKTLFDAGGVGGDGSYELQLGHDHFHAAVEGDRLDLRRGSADAPDAVIEAEPGALAAALWHSAPLEGRVAIAGDRRRARRFLARFPLPEPAAS
jgi:DNA-binding HxlR family transcriptional regulator